MGLGKISQINGKSNVFWVTGTAGLFAENKGFKKEYFKRLLLVAQYWSYTHHDYKLKYHIVVIF